MVSQYVSVLQHLNDSLDTLSPQQQRAAHYVLNHPQEVGLQSMRAVATAARVTPATISRMCRTLGFKNYQSFKAPFVQSLRNTGPGYVSQFKNVQERGAEHTSDLYAELRTQDIANVEHSISDANFPVLFDAAETIRTSRRVYVLGLRGCYSAAFYFHYAYQLFRDNSRLVESHAGMFADQFRGMSSDDCMLVISFDPYTKMTIDAIEYAASAKVKVIAVTDKLVSPVARSAVHTIVTFNKSPSFYQSLTGALAVNHALITLLVANTGSNSMQLLEEAEKQLSGSSAYW